MGWWPGTTLGREATGEEGLWKQLNSTPTTDEITLKVTSLSVSEIERDQLVPRIPGLTIPTWIGVITPR